jgi:hypothetical protein
VIHRPPLTAPRRVTWCQTSLIKSCARCRRRTPQPDDESRRTAGGDYSIQRGRPNPDGRLFGQVTSRTHQISGDDFLNKATDTGAQRSGTAHLPPPPGGDLRTAGRFLPDPAA